MQEGLGELIGMLREMGFAVKLDTNWSRPDVMAEMLGKVAYVAMDVKCAPEEYPERTGWADTAALARSLAIFIRMIRESSSICCSPSPRIPMPPAMPRWRFK